MGCTVSSTIKQKSAIVVDNSRDARNAEIEEQLKREKEERRNHMKLILLGAAECGKSTIFKQIR